MACRVYKPLLRAFLLPSGAPDPGAPPRRRQRFFPLTAGDMQRLPDLVRAPQRGLDSIAIVLRRWLLVMAFSSDEAVVSRGLVRSARQSMALPTGADQKELVDPPQDHLLPWHA